MSYPIGKILAILLVGAVSALAPDARSQAVDSCLKQVFERYCLGGNFASLMRQSPKPLHRQKESEREAAIYLETHGRTYVMAFRGRIYKVLRQFRPNTQLRYQDLSEILQQKYGPPKDRSRFPHYADSRAAQVVAIRRGEGQATRTWNPAEGWSVELSWTREMGIAVSYIAVRLNAAQLEAMEAGL